jgi:GTP cyclohydrolase I
VVLARSIPVRSVCEHICCRSSVSRMSGTCPVSGSSGCPTWRACVEYFAHRPQVQERLTKQIADWLAEHLAAEGVGVVIEAEHSCMTLRGVQAAGTQTVTSALLGTLRNDARSRAEFFALTGTRTPRRRRAARELGGLRTEQR